MSHWGRSSGFEALATVVNSGGEWWWKKPNDSLRYGPFKTASAAAEAARGEGYRTDSTSHTMIDQAIAKVDAVVKTDAMQPGRISEGIQKPYIGSYRNEWEVLDHNGKSRFTTSVRDDPRLKVEFNKAWAVYLEAIRNRNRSDSSPLDAACAKMDAVVRKDAKADASSTDYQKGFEDGKDGRDPKRPGGSGPNHDYDEGYRAGRREDRSKQAAGKASLFDPKLATQPWTPQSARQQRGGTFGT